MAIRDSEEVLPLLGQGNNDDSENNAQYQSFVQSKEGRNYVLPKHRTDNNASDSLAETELNYQTETGLWEHTIDTRSGQLQYRVHPSEQRITYSWNNINVYDTMNKTSSSLWKKVTNTWKGGNILTKKPKHILKNVYGMANPGELLAIMGSSGAGKTTLLNALTFQVKSNNVVKGLRYLNNYPINNKNTIAKLSAYVEQDNLFLGTLTVKEHLIFQALIRMDPNIPYRQRMQRVEEVITELGLQKCKNTIIGCPGRTKGISGGEMKRLSFASEVLTNPPLMFCDEPTSGLDSFIALNVITVLKSMAVRGKTVICTIHQPSSEIFSLFDKILLLAEGRTAFLGRPKDAITFFTELGASSPLANYNPADFYIQLLAVVPNQEEQSRETINHVCDTFAQSLLGLEVATKIECRSDTNRYQPNVSYRKIYRSSSDYPDDFTYKTPWFAQFRALFWRSWLSIIKEPLLVKVRLFQTVVLSLVVGLIYHQQKLNEDGVMNINGVLFTFLTNMTFQNLFAVISVFCSELPIFMKEHSNKMYRVDAYFLSKTLAEVPMFLAIPIIFICITYYWIGLNPALKHFGAAALILVLVTNVATSFGYFISCISTNVVMALSVGPPVIIPFLLFGGFLLNSGAVPTYFEWLSYLSWFKYGNEALLINQWSDIDTIECKNSNVTCPRTGEIVLEIYHFKKDNFLWDLISLLILILVFRCLAYFSLVLRALRHQRQLHSNE